MPTSYELDENLSLVRSQAWGLLTDEESSEHYASIQADPKFKPHFRQLCDLRLLDEIDTSASALRQLARLRVFAPGVRRAFVAPADLHFGLARMLQVFCEQEGTEVGVFRTVPEAEAWLDIPAGSGTTT